HILERLEKLLSDYFNSDDLATQGLPTVQYISKNLNISPTYLLSLLKTLTGRTTQQHIHDKLMDKAKEKLTTTNPPFQKLLTNWALNICNRSANFSRQRQNFCLSNLGNHFTEPKKPSN
ncbi:hypothetical protein, partial [Pseudomonas viridiflava]|uniref:helix-turn-helix domain-containing protein n=1 Tax=Pseudomonas viridiflava TaxID=33069 RepID=UPI0030C88DE0